MGVQGGSITTDIIKNGLVFNMDAANRASTIPSTSTDKTFNTVDTSVSGSFINDTFYDSSTISPSFDFDGTDDYIQTNFLQDATNNFSVFSWINVDSPSNTKYQFLGTREESTGASTSKGFVFQLNGSREVQARIFTTTSNITQVNAGVVTNGIWANVAFTYVASIKTLKIFRNGIEVGSATGTAAGVTSPDSMSIGRAATGGQYGYFDGNIGPIHIYNRALPSNEVLHNYNALKGRFGL
tara:strand:- start:4738 stop:5457 length:720 start_codon:yes stop_codon:yes gene_type:complete